MGQDPSARCSTGSPVVRSTLTRTAFAVAIRARFDLPWMINSQKALAELTVGERVRINERATPATCAALRPPSSRSTRAAPPSTCTAPSAASRAVRSAARHWSSTGSPEPPKDDSRGDMMSCVDRADLNLDDLIAEITVDCYDEDEVL